MEATNLLARVYGGRVACLDFVLSGGAVLVPTSAASLRRARELMVRSADCPMELADSAHSGHARRDSRNCLRFLRLRASSFVHAEPRELSENYAVLFGG